MEIREEMVYEENEAKDHWAYFHSARVCLLPGWDRTLTFTTQCEHSVNSDTPTHSDILPKVLLLLLTLR